MELSNGDAGASPYLRLLALRKSFGKTIVVDGINLEAAPSKFICVLGPSGCGKTTLLRLIAGFERADAGAIYLGGKDVTRLPPEARDYGIVFQSYALFPNRTVAGNISFGLEATGAERGQRARRIEELLALVGLAEHAGKYPNQISGGQQQRVALARALALSPGLLLLDEPLSALDANVRTHLREELLSLQRRIGVTALMVTHDREEAFSVADQIVVMNKGKIEQSGAPAELYGKPANLFVAKLLGGCNAIALDQIQAVNPEVRTPPQLNGHTAYACIRPGAVLVGKEAAGQQNRFAGRVASLTFLGDIVRIVVVSENAAAIIIEAEVLRSRLDSLPEPGGLINVALPSRDIMTLAGTP